MARSTLTLPRLAALAAAMSISAAAPTVASAAGTVTSVSGVMTVTPASGQADRLSIFHDTISGTNSVVAVDNPPSGSFSLTPSTGCAAYGIWAGCAWAPLTRVNLNGGDLDDRLDGGASVSVTFDGGSGDDWMHGNAGFYHVYNGGTGSRDTVNYAYDSQPIAASINGTQDDGPLGRENIATDVERVVGGDNNDTLQGAAGSRSTLMGQDGNDSLTAGAAGADLRGGFGNDTLVGGSGDDTFTDYVGTDSFNGGGGNDTFYAEDGDNADTITCGAGTDEAWIDSSDTVTDPANCERMYY